MVPHPFYSWEEHFAVDLGGATAVFTTRRGGFSDGPYATLNLGRGHCRDGSRWSDDPVAVERNRVALQARVQRQLTFVRQVHGTTIEPARAASHGLPEADGQVVDAPGLAPLVLTADCLPIAVSAGRAAAILHAGWRGLAGGVVGAGVAALRELAGSERLSAAIGPGAGPCCYEVSQEVHERFAPLAGIARRGNNLDLKAVARHQLTEAGVERVHDIGLCTICADPSLFFSHRRDGGVTGRQAGLVWLS
jgi:YfiH family protein